jgi:curved DNA-binding protein CbpA
MKTHYETLGVPRNASQNDIRRAYRKLAVKYHPDKHLGDKKYESLLKEVNIAYETLSDPAQRDIYDFLLFQNERQQSFPYADSESRGREETPATSTSDTTTPSHSFHRIKALFYFAIAVVVILWLLSSMSNDDQTSDPNRPKSGELDFKHPK